MALLSTHVLDLSRGRPASGLQIELFRLDGNDRELVRVAQTNENGRTPEPLIECEPLPEGTFELVFHAGDYFQRMHIETTDPPFLDQVVIRFGIDSARGSYHVPLLLSPYGYTTYRGS